MDNFVESKWFVRIVAFLLAFLLYMTVNFGDFESVKQAGSGALDTTEVLTNVPLKTYYDTENLYVSGVPEQVRVEISGPKSIIESTKRLRDFEVNLDLTDYEIGKHRVAITHKNFSDKLDVSIQPATVDVNIEEKVTTTKTVTPEFNDSALAEGYQVDNVTVAPREVKVTGSESDIEKIAFVRTALTGEDEIDEETTATAAVQVLDGNLNKLDVKVEPETVQVSIAVKNPSKKVPLNPVAKGTPADNVKISSLQPDVDEITIYGKESALKELKEFSLPVDVSGITKDTTLTVPVNLGEQFNFSSPQEVKVKVTVEKSTEKSS
ncbi:CdaR family protein [Domibacillus indicus]|uniref:CdaR family protein n=1 Tax=Domibacillus indicus TaxID=1437523 RepID=UPI0020404465|nr:CdaR family protein [Domibacillus indicus]MCM3789674.1 CdaR family protein [Domibacillus indicus]